MTDKIIQDGIVRLRDYGFGSAEITISNPPVNALSINLVDKLSIALSHVTKSKDFKFLVIKGSGGHFSAGADLKERASMTEAETLQFLNKLNDCFELIENLEIPTIAEIEGATLGGGAELALCCDIISSSPGALNSECKIGFPETTLGIIPGAGGTYRIYKKMNPGIAKYWILSGKIFSISEAKRDGFIDIQVENLIELKSYFFDNSRISLIVAKKSMNKCYLELDRKKQRLIELEEYKKTLNSPERKEALKKYKKK